MKRIIRGKELEVVNPAPFGYDIHIEYVDTPFGYAEVHRAVKKRTKPAPSWPPAGKHSLQIDADPKKAIGLEEQIAQAIAAGVSNARELVTTAPNKGVAVMRLRNAMRQAK